MNHMYQYVSYENVARKGLRHTGFWWIAINALVLWIYVYDADIRIFIIFALIVICIFDRDPKDILFIYPLCLHVCFTHNLFIILIVHKILHCTYLLFSYVVY